ERQVQNVGVAVGRVFSVDGGIGRGQPRLTPSAIQLFMRAAVENKAAPQENRCSFHLAGVLHRTQVYCTNFFRPWIGEGWGEEINAARCPSLIHPSAYPR